MAAPEREACSRSGGEDPGRRETQIRRRGMESREIEQAIAREEGGRKGRRTIQYSQQQQFGDTGRWNTKDDVVFEEK